MPFIVIETDRPDRVAIVPLDEAGPAVTVRELARAATLAELMNAIEDEELRRVRARHAAVAAAHGPDLVLTRADNGHAGPAPILADVKTAAPPAGDDDDDDDDDDDQDDDDATAIVIGGSD